MLRAFMLNPPALLRNLPRQLSSLLLLMLPAFPTLAGQVTVTWDVNTNPAVTGYKLYYGQASRSYTSSIDVGKQTTCTISNLIDGKTYYFSATDYDASGMESGYSNEVSTVAGGTAPTGTSGGGTTTGSTPLTTSISATPTSGPAPLAVVFTSTASGGTVSSYSWSFGDGTSSTEANPKKTYSTAGTYTVSLTVTSTTGAKTTATKDKYIAVSAFSTPAATAQETLWDEKAKPANPSEADGNPVNLGVKFVATRSGFIRGVRFYKSLANQGTHIGALWTRRGQLLASATFTGETESGWQQVNFASPVAISANTVYVASYFAPQGRYANDSGYFSQAGVSRGSLSALRNGVRGPNGVYIYANGNAFPWGGYQATNYWVDVVFAPTN